jgi:ketosteroid isomerase-like protein
MNTQVYRFFGGAVLAALLAGDWSGGVATASAAQDSAQAVRAAHERRRTATVNGDAAAVDSMMTDDLTFTHANAVVETKAEFVGALRTGRYDDKSITDEEQQVRMYGDSGVVTGICRIVVNASGTNVDIRVRFVELWVKQGSAWRMALWHATEVR